MSRCKWYAVHCGLIVGACGLLSAVGLAQDVDKARSAGELDRKASKDFTFEMQNKPWRNVLEWLADQSGVPLSTSALPAGTFTFIPPKGNPHRFTLPQVIDILNESLAKQKYILIRCENSFLLLPSDEKIDPSLLPRIDPQDFDLHGNSELVQLVLTLKRLSADDTATEVKKMMGPFGNAQVMKRANQLVLQDTVGNLKKIYQTLKVTENHAESTRSIHAYVCHYARASDAVKLVRELLDDLLEPFDGRSSRLPIAGSGGHAGDRAPPRVVLPERPLAYAYRIAADDRTNAVLIKGPAGIIAQAQEILKYIDQPARGSEIVKSMLTFKTYPLSDRNAPAVARILQEIYRKSPDIRISEVGSTEILVYAGEDEQLAIGKLLAYIRKLSE
jgi:type II secretory pathway component GspD/PulD (secretin)